MVILAIKDRGNIYEDYKRVLYTQNHYYPIWYIFENQKTTFQVSLRHLFAIILFYYTDFIYNTTFIYPKIIKIILTYHFLKKKKKTLCRFKQPTRQALFILQHMKLLSKCLFTCFLYNSLQVHFVFAFVLGGYQ